MVEAIHLRNVLANTNVVDKVQQSQQQHQDHTLRQAIQEDLREYALKKDAVNLTNKLENKVIVKDDTGKQNSKGKEQKRETKENDKTTDLNDETFEGTIIDIHV